MLVELDDVINWLEYPLGAKMGIYKARRLLAELEEELKKKNEG